MWVCDYYDDLGRRKRETFVTKAEAQAREAEITLAKARGLPVAAVDKKTTFAEFVPDWWRRYAQVELAPKTQADYEWTLDKHLLPYLGSKKLIRVAGDLELLQDWRAWMIENGTGPAAQRKAGFLLQRIMRHAQEWGRTHTNAVERLKKASGQRAKVIRPWPPEVLELIRLELRQVAQDEQRDAWAAVQDAALVAVIAYGGLRPMEARALERKDDQGGQLVLDWTKTRTPRTVPVERPLRAVLDELYEAQGQRPPTAPTFPMGTRSGGGAMTTDSFKNWHQRRFAPACKRLADEFPEYAHHLIGATPYFGRHTAASLWLAEGLPLTTVAKRMGHSVKVLSETYAAEIEGLANKPAKPAAARLEEAALSARAMYDGHKMDTKAA